MFGRRNAVRSGLKEGQTTRWVRRVGARFFRSPPTPRSRDNADDGLGSRFDVDSLNDDLLRDALSSASVERLDLRDE